MVSECLAAICLTEVRLSLIMPEVSDFCSENSFSLVIQLKDVYVEIS